MSNRARRIKRLHGLDMIVVDYIQLMKGTSSNKDVGVQEFSQFTQGLKAIAKELAIPVLALSQLSRQVEQRDDHKPQLADLRDQDQLSKMQMWSCLFIEKDTIFKGRSLEKRQ